MENNVENKITRKYNSEFRKNLKHKISKLTNKSDFLQIYKIISNDIETKISINMNGIYFNINILSDNSIEQIITLLNEKLDTETISETNKIVYESYNKDISFENFIQGHKLTNEERTLIKKYHNKNS